jgi:hypothetical protein
LSILCILRRHGWALCQADYIPCMNPLQG